MEAELAALLRAGAPARAVRITVRERVVARMERGPLGAREVGEAVESVVRAACRLAREVNAPDELVETVCRAALEAVRGHGGQSSQLACRGDARRHGPPPARPRISTDSTAPARGVFTLLVRCEARSSFQVQSGSPSRTRATPSVTPSAVSFPKCSGPPVAARVVAKKTGRRVVCSSCGRWRSKATRAPRRAWPGR